MDPSDICLLKGGALEKYWEKSIAIDKCHFENPPKYFFSYQSLFEAVDNHQCKYAVIIESAVTSMIRNRYCGKFVIVGKPIFTGGLSMLLPKGSNLTEGMSRVTLDLVGNRTTSYISAFFDHLPLCRTEVATLLSFMKLRWFFFTAFSVGGALLLALVIIPQKADEEV
eukprot:gb/GEZJ01002042.1/.p1 GENE.gb/GEZJ01002042.1/~~gb/GEZJ01002042.1/.p1  ORF type:complete len:168 (-),score=21.73 gb/GEZJ01002042.1/:260-763(-)